MKVQKSLKKNATLNFIKTILSLCFPLITFPYSTRVLGPDNLGKVNFAQSIVSYFSIIATLGISTYATREAAKIRDDKQKLNQFCREIFTINMISTVVSYLFLMICLIFIKKFKYYKELIIICSSLIMFTTIGMSWLYQALEDYFYITVRSLIFQILSVIMLFIFVRNKDDYLWYAAINVISNAGANILNFTHSKKYISFKGTGHPQLRRHLKPVFILFATSLTGTIFSNIDVSMLGFLSTDKEIGFYSAGLKIVRMIQHIFPAITIVLFPRISYYIEKKDENSILQLSDKTINFLLCATLPITVGLFILIKPVVMLFCGPTYIPAVSVARFMCPFIVFTALSDFLGGNILVASGKENLNLISIITACIIDIILNFFLIPKYHANGAVVATLLTNIYILFFDIICLRDFLKKFHFLLPLAQYLFSTTLMGISVYFINKTIHNIFINLTVSVIVGIIVYLLILNIMRNKFLIEQEQIIKQKIKTIRKAGNE